ncbi:hypothetical protein CsSME_00052901 [Camellia sinensis var. sinensis]
MAVGIVSNGDIRRWRLGCDVQYSQSSCWHISFSFSS